MTCLGRPALSSFNPTYNCWLLQDPELLLTDILDILDIPTAAAGVGSLVVPVAGDSRYSAPRWSLSTPSSSSVPTTVAGDTHLDQPASQAQMTRACACVMTSESTKFPHLPLPLLPP